MRRQPCARRPLQPIARRARIANEYTPHESSATRIFGSATRHRLHARIGRALHLRRPDAADGQAGGQEDPADRHARAFIASSTCSDGSRA